MPVYHFAVLSQPHWLWYIYFMIKHHISRSPSQSRPRSPAITTAVCNNMSRLIYCGNVWYTFQERFSGSQNGRIGLRQDHNGRKSILLGGSPSPPAAAAFPPPPCNSSLHFIILPIVSFSLDFLSQNLQDCLSMNFYAVLGHQISALYTNSTRHIRGKYSSTTIFSLAISALSKACRGACWIWDSSDLVWSFKGTQRVAVTARRGGAYLGEGVTLFVVVTTVRSLRDRGFLSNLWAIQIQMRFIFHQNIWRFPPRTSLEASERWLVGGCLGKVADALLSQARKL